ncbi:50S ribosomal protein L9 [Aquimarina pacifica]|uniref:50S ribosomal protein L9 n=1 Tax=Aquimarina pacifica TaxID=1296415 RepID=UPI000472EDD9|nr:50S ribosomal protein L9 [Aquimarina pacifica]
MELILKKDVENLGFVDDVVEVKNGYGRNFLIPNGLAVLATPSARKVLAETLKQRAFKEKKEIEDAEKLAKKIAGFEIKISAKSGTGGKLFGSISNANVSEALAKEDIQLDKKFITVPGGTIKRLGQYEASVRLHRTVIAAVPFEVVAQA